MRISDWSADVCSSDLRPEWWSLCLTRDPVAGDDTVGETMVKVTVNSTPVTFSMLNGSVRCIDNGEPVAPSMERLRKAVSDKRVVPYGSNAFTGWPYQPDWEVKLPGAYSEYHADRINGRDASHSVIGTISAQGGEYSSSRGFLSGEDALMSAAALKGRSEE